MLVIFIFPLNTNTIQLINTINPMIAKNSIIFKYTFEKPTIGSKANNKRKTINPILIHEYLQSILSFSFVFHYIYFTNSLYYKDLRQVHIRSNKIFPASSALHI